jgi:hypothetical protein
MLLLANRVYKDKSKVLGFNIYIYNVAYKEEDR